MTTGIIISWVVLPLALIFLSRFLVKPMEDNNMRANVIMACMVIMWVRVLVAGPGDPTLLSDPDLHHDADWVKGKKGAIKTWYKSWLPPTPVPGTMSSDTTDLDQQGDVDNEVVQGWIKERMAAPTPAPVSFNAGKGSSGTRLISPLPLAQPTNIVAAGWGYLILALIWTLIWMVYLPISRGDEAKALFSAPGGGNLMKLIFGATLIDIVTDLKK